MAKKIPVIDRFYNKFDPEPNTGCWLWNGSFDGVGYGLMKVRPHVFAAHRYSYELFYGKFNKKLCVCHKCDVRSCVNPQHLFLGSHKDNIRDASNKKRLWVNHQNGSANLAAKLTENQVIEIREKYKNGARQVDLCKEYALGDASMHNIVRRKSWAHV